MPSKRAYKGMNWERLCAQHNELSRKILRQNLQIRSLEKDLELLREFIWDDHDATWPKDVHAVLHRAMDRLMSQANRRTKTQAH